MTSWDPRSAPGVPQAVVTTLPPSTPSQHQGHFLEAVHARGPEGKDGEPFRYRKIEPYSLPPTSSTQLPEACGGQATMPKPGETSSLKDWPFQEKYPIATEVLVFLSEMARTKLRLKLFPVISPDQPWSFSAALLKTNGQPRIARCFKTCTTFQKAARGCAPREWGGKSWKTT